VLVTGLDTWEKHREGGPNVWSMVLVIALGSWGKHREEEPKGWCTLLVTALGSWGKPVPHGHGEQEMEDDVKDCR
jgi:hypothetical protein